MMWLIIVAIVVAIILLVMLIILISSPDKSTSTIQYETNYVKSTPLDVYKQSSYEAFHTTENTTYRDIVNYADCILTIIKATGDIKIENSFEEYIATSPITADKLIIYMSELYILSNGSLYKVEDFNESTWQISESNFPTGITYISTSLDSQSLFIKAIDGHYTYHCGIVTKEIVSNNVIVFGYDNETKGIFDLEKHTIVYNGQFKSNVKACCINYDGMLACLQDNSIYNNIKIINWEFINF